MTTGTVELTGLEMIHIKALGANVAAAVAKSRTIPALILKRSSRVIPGFLGIPAGITTVENDELEAEKKIYFLILTYQHQHPQ